MKRKPKTPKPAAVRIGTEDQEPSRDYWKAEVKLAIRHIAGIEEENRQLKATVANQLQLIKELREDNNREFAAGGRHAVQAIIDAVERWYGTTSKVLADLDIDDTVERVAKAVRHFAEGAGSSLAQAAAMRLGAKAKADQQAAAPATIESLSKIVPMSHSGKTAANQ